MANKSFPDTWVAVTPGNNPLGYIATALYIGVTGDVKVNQTFADAVTFKNVQQGTTIVGMFSQVYSSGTTATNILAAKLNT